MSDDVATAARSGETVFPLSDRGCGARVPRRGAGGTRRGIRLERFFWASLKRLAESRKSTLGQVVEEISRVQPETGNLTSAIRVACMRWLADQNAELAQAGVAEDGQRHPAGLPVAGIRAVVVEEDTGLQPCFPACWSDVSLPVGPGEDARQDLKLALDLNVADIFVRLEDNGEQPVVTGFVIGAGDRRYRAQLNVVRAPVSEPELLLAFVFGG